MITPQAPSTLTARITDWDHQKGYGFLQVGKRRIFLHRRDFAEHHKKPAVGDTIQFTMGADARGRTCAKQAIHVNDGGRITILTLCLTAGLLVLPAVGLHHRGVNLLWVALYILVLGAITYTLYASDKRRARAGEWRIPEAQLQFLEILGGWPGGFLAQRRLRHKCTKGTYQFTFWLIVLLYQFAAYDSLQNWRFSRAAWTRIELLTASAPATQSPPGHQLGSPPRTPRPSARIAPFRLAQDPRPARV